MAMITSQKKHLHNQLGYFSNHDGNDLEQNDLINDFDDESHISMMNSFGLPLAFGKAQGSTIDASAVNRQKRNAPCNSSSSSIISIGTTTPSSTTTATTTSSTWEAIDHGCDGPFNKHTNILPAYTHPNNRQSTRSVVPLAFIGRKVSNKHTLNRSTCQNINKASFSPTTDNDLCSNNDNISSDDVINFDSVEHDLNDNSKENYGDIKDDDNDQLSSCEEMESDIPLSMAYRRLPLGKEVDIPAHEKTVATIDVSSKGSRMISGGYDNIVRFWDFHGMTMSMKSFYELVPAEGHPVQSLCYSSSSSKFLCAGGNAICSIYDLDGNFIQQTVQGDMYVRDTANTKGHTHMVTDCIWHPLNDELFITSSLDATIRIWNLTSKPYGVDLALPSIHCLKAVDKRNLNITNCHVLCCTITKNSSKCIVGGCVDGSIQIWNEKKSYGKPDKIIRDAHTAELTDLVFFSDNTRLLSRSLDSTMKLWDIRAMNKPTFIWDDLPVFQSKTNIALSPIEDIIVTSTQSKHKHQEGKLCMYDARTHKEIYKCNFEGFAGVKTLWSAALNQIIVGCTNGKVKILFSEQVSVNGALLFINRLPKQEQVDIQFNKEIYTPESLPSCYRETKRGNLLKVKSYGREKDKNIQMQKTIVPPLPTGKEGSGGQAATCGNFSQYALKKFNFFTAEKDVEEEDVVEALRKQAKVENDSGIVSKLYKQNQPHKILDYSMAQDDDEELLSNTRKCPRCGLKLCQCGFMTLDESMKSRLLKGGK